MSSRVFSVKVVQVTGEDPGALRKQNLRDVFVTKVYGRCEASVFQRNTITDHTTLEVTMSYRAAWGPGVVRR